MQGQDWLADLLREMRPFVEESQLRHVGAVAAALGIGGAGPGSAGPGPDRGRPRLRVVACVGSPGRCN